MPLLLSVCCLLGGLSAFGRTLTYDTSRAGAWADASSWTEGEAPAADDTLLIPGDARLTDADAAAVASVAQITIASNATLTVENDETITLAGYVSGGGRLVKKGVGLLDYTRLLGDVQNWTETTTYLLDGGTVISNGTVRFPLHDGAAGVSWCVGPMTVVAPGVLDVPGNCNFVMSPLCGNGTILNSKGSLTQLRPKGTSVFDGYLSGANIRVYTQADITFTCLTNSIQYNEFSTWGGCISFPHFGNKGELSPPGPNAALKIRDFGGTIRYLGAGETTDRDFMLFHQADTQSCVMDAGATGGVTFTGTMSMDRWDRWNRLILTGSNTVPMVISGAMTEQAPVTIIKKGSGTWSFRDTADNATKRTQKGIYDVQDGVLQFDSIADIGKACALGPQTKLVPTTNPLLDISNVVDTAFLLGAEAGPTGTLRYAGTAAASSDRLIGVVGKGRLENASTAAFAWNGGVRATGTAVQGAELILAGDTAAESTISNLRDGTDGKPLAVTKEGSGTWTFCDNTTFSGKLSVKAGTVAIAQAKGTFTWYKWTLKETGAGRAVRNGKSVNESNTGARQIRFYDADGNALPMSGLTEDAACSVASLQPNGMTYDGDVIQTRYTTGNAATADGDTGRNLNRLVDGQDTEWLVAPRVRPTRLDVPSSWFSVVFRFPEGTPQAASYDVVSYGAAGVRSVCAWKMSGSADGVIWYDLDEQEIDPIPGGWMSDGSASSGKGTGFALEDGEDTSVYGLPNATAEVAPGAALVSSRPELGLPLPTPLVVTPGASYGRYAGFAVPTAGTVNIAMPLTWFRVTVLETTGGKTVREGGTATDPNVQMHEFALYDAAGVRRNVGLKVDSRNQPADLEPGFVTYSRSGCIYYTDRDADKLFDDAAGGNGWCVNFAGYFVRLDDSSSWIQMTMRLDDADPGIASYDWCAYAASNYVRTVSSWRLEGSADGQTWVVLDEKIDYADRPGGGKWWSDGSAFVAGQLRTGFPISTDAMAGLVSLRDLAWTIDLSGCSNTVNIAKWKVCVNGAEVPRAQMLYKDGELRAVPPGFIIHFR